MGLAGNVSLLAFHSNSCLFFLSFKIQKKAGGGGLLQLAGEAGGSSLPGHPASPPASFPASPGPLSGSRAAAHMVPCQIPGGSGGHVSGSLQRHRPRVTMETAANGKPALPAGAEPSAAGAGGAGRGAGRGAGPRRREMRAGPGSPPPRPRRSEVRETPTRGCPWASLCRAVSGTSRQRLLGTPGIFFALKYKVKSLYVSRSGFRSYQQHLTS